MLENLLTEQTRQSIDDHLKFISKSPDGILFLGRRAGNQCLTTRHYGRLVSQLINSIGLDASLFGTHSLRRTKATLIFRRTGNLRAVQLLLGHTKIESTVRYNGVEVDDALTIAEQVDIWIRGRNGHVLLSNNTLILCQFRTLKLFSCLLIFAKLFHILGQFIENRSLERLLSNVEFIHIDFYSVSGQKSHTTFVSNGSTSHDLGYEYKLEEWEIISKHQHWGERNVSIQNYRVHFIGYG